MVLFKAEMDKHKRTFKPGEPRDLMDVYLQILASDNKKPSFSGNIFIFYIGLIIVVFSTGDHQQWSGNHHNDDPSAKAAA